MTPIWQQREAFGVRGSAYNWSHDTMDAKTACDIIDHMFLTLEGSTWAGQYGFQWSVFYLQRRGMTRNQIQTFMTCFNAIIKQRKLEPGREEPSPDLVESLRRACRYDEPDRPEMAPVARFSPRRFREAETYWTDVFRDAPHEARTADLRDPLEMLSDAVHAHTCSVEPIEGEGDTGIVYLAAYWVLIARLTGWDDLSLVVRRDHPQARAGCVPLRIKAPWSMTFADLCDQIGCSIEAAFPHRHAAFHILSRPCPQSGETAISPVFELGFRYHHGESRETPTIADICPHPEISTQVGVLLEVSLSSLRLVARRSWLGSERLEALSAYLARIIAEVTDSPTRPIEAIPFEDMLSSPNEPSAMSRWKTFDFSN